MLRPATLNVGVDALRETDILSALQVWMGAGLGQTEWSTPLTWSLSATGAKAIALVQKKPGGIDVLGASVGASADFLQLCRDMVIASCAPGIHERHVVGVGQLAWSVVIGQRLTLVTFALYENRADLRLLGEVSRMAERCVISSLSHRVC